jgi:glycosyltransferase involved in cell wall biosynthesis
MRRIAGVAERARLTLREHGPAELLRRALVAPLRGTPVAERFGYGTRYGPREARARAWARRNRPDPHVVTLGADPLRAPAGRDLLLLEPGCRPRPDAVERLAWAAHADARNAGAVPVVRGPGGVLQSAGVFRTPDGTTGHRLHGRPATDHVAPVPVLAAAGALYLRADAVPAAFEAGATAGLAEISERCRQHGGRLVVEPSAVVEGALAAAPPLSAPSARADARLRVVYVTEETGVGGGHRDVFEHLNRLGARGHDVSLYTLGSAPDWFPLAAPVRSFSDWPSLVEALAAEDALKIATWWRSAEPVWEAGAARGRPVYFVQDIETSYYPDSRAMRDEVLATYREEFSYLTISGWNRDRLAELGRPAALVPPGIDLATFRPLEGVARRDDVVLALGRANPLKNLPLTVDAWRQVGEPRPELWLFGVEPELGPRHGARYFERPEDEHVNRLLNEATVFAMTSVHEGFCLPALEAMAAGAAVVATDADGNLDFCRDGVNCLLVESEPRAVAAAIEHLLRDPALRAQLGRGGVETARAYDWDVRIDQLEAELRRIAG